MISPSYLSPATVTTGPRRGGAGRSRPAGCPGCCAALRPIPVGPPGPARPAGADRPAVRGRAEPQRLGQRLLLGGRPGRLAVLEGVLLRLLQAANTITVDKTPPSLWPMALSVRFFGLTSWCVLVPQAPQGVATVGLLYATVRRWFRPAAGLLAGATLALTPVAALMFRFNNPDALLTLLLALAAYATLRAIEDGRLRWLILAGALVGLAFLTKLLQVFLVLPADHARVRCVAGCPGWRHQILHSARHRRAHHHPRRRLVARHRGAHPGVVPAPTSAARAHSILQLALGYNGLAAWTATRPGRWASTAAGRREPVRRIDRPGRLFASEMGGQISWLLPAALIALAALVWLSWRRPGPIGSGPRRCCGAAG